MDRWMGEWVDGWMNVWGIIGTIKHVSMDREAKCSFCFHEQWKLESSAKPSGPKMMRRIAEPKPTAPWKASAIAVALPKPSGHGPKKARVQQIWNGLSAISEVLVHQPPPKSETEVACRFLTQCALSGKTCPENSPPSRGKPFLHSASTQRLNFSKLSLD